MLDINFSGHHVDVTPALKTLALEKFKKLERHFTSITSIDVVFKVEKLDHIVEATVLIPKARIHAHAKSNDMYAAIDELVDKLESQLETHKDKHR